MSMDKLIQKASEAQQNAYAPYSNFKVGAALLTKLDTIFTGANIENSSYSLTCCAERIAIFKAISEGERYFKSLVIIGDTEKPIQPCGACRQVMAEFFDDKVEILLMNNKGDKEQTTISRLLPSSFSLYDN